MHHMRSHERPCDLLLVQYWEQLFEKCEQFTDTRNQMIFIYRLAFMHGRTLDEANGAWKQKVRSVKWANSQKKWNKQGKYGEKKPKAGPTAWLWEVTTKERGVCQVHHILHHIDADCSAVEQKGGKIEQRVKGNIPILDSSRNTLLFENLLVINRTSKCLISQTSCGSSSDTDGAPALVGAGDPSGWNNQQRRAHDA